MRTIALLFILLIVCSCCLAGGYTPIPPVVVSSKKQVSFSPQKAVITNEDIASMGATSLSQVLQELGGVQIQNIVGNDSQVMLGMRGFGINASSNTLLL